MTKHRVCLIARDTKQAVVTEFGNFIARGAAVANSEGRGITYYQ